MDMILYDSAIAVWWQLGIVLWVAELEKGHCLVGRHVLGQPRERRQTLPWQGRQRQFIPWCTMNIADIDLTSHGGNIDGHMSIGNLPTANGHFNGVGILQLDANGQADVCAITDNCTMTIWTYGYVA